MTDPITQSMMQGAAGAASGEKKLYVDEVFEINSWIGTGSAQTVTTNKDLPSGGMMMIKNRTQSGNSWLVYDNERGLNQMAVDTTWASANNGFLTAISDTGFTTNNGAEAGGADKDKMCAFTFLKAPGFFDVVKYTGTGSNRTIAHDLDATPGMMWVKRTDTTSNWIIYHNEAGPEYYWTMTNSGIVQSFDHWNSTAPTTSVFSVGTSSDTNASGGEYMAYLWANNSAKFGENENQAIVSTGKFSAAGSWTYSATPGWEPYLFLTWPQGTGDVWEFDQALGGLSTYDSGTHNRLRLNTSGSSWTWTASGLTVTSTGVIWDPGYGMTGANTGGANNMYWMCIRAPDKLVGKPAELASEVFDIATGAGTANTAATTPKMQLTMRPDYAMQKTTSGATKWYDATRLATHLYMPRPTGENQGTNTAWAMDYDKGWLAYDGHTDWTGPNSKSWNWKRNPDTFGIAHWTGNGGQMTLTNPVKTAPEMIIARQTTTSTGTSNLSWIVYHKNMISSNPGEYVAYLETTGSRVTSNAYNNTTPGVNTLNVGGDLATSGKHYQAFVWASKTGICKVGGFTWTTANGSGDIDCGFTVRYLLLKPVSISSSWLMVDTDKGISNSGAEDFMRPNNESSYTQNGSNYDIANTITNGFIVPPTHNWANTDGAEWIYLAHA